MTAIFSLPTLKKIGLLYLAYEGLSLVMVLASYAWFTGFI